MTRKWIMTGMAAFAFATVAHAGVKQGEAAPDFTAKAAVAGRVVGFTLSEALKKGPVVVYFYPAAFTRGCNLEAHAFAEQLEKFKAAGASVVGVSLDGIARLKEYSSDPETCAGKVTVASDAEGKIAKAFGVAVKPGAADKKDSKGVEIKHGFAERTTFVIGRERTIVAALSGLSPEKHVEKALEAVQSLNVREW